MQAFRAEPTTGWHYIRVLAPLVVVVCLVASLAVASVHVLGAVRAYVGGESRWSKARSTAIQSLRDYAASQDPSDLVRFSQSLQVPLGDRQAREQLLSPKPDLAKVREGFLLGENHPEDIDGMVMLFQRLGWLPVFHRALTTWTHADELIEQLQALALRLQQQVHLHDTAGLKRTLSDLQSLNDALLHAERAFGTDLAEASRQTVFLLTISIVCSALMLTGLTGLLLHRTLKRQHAHQLAEAELGAQAQAAEKVAAAQRAFLSRLSHELRTPLNAILGFAQLISMDQQQLPAGVEDKVDALALGVGRRLLHLIEDVLDLTKVESGDIPLTIQRTDAREVLQASLQLVESTRQQYGVDIVELIGPDPLWVMADPQRLQQVFINLLSNGCKYNTRDGQIHLSAEVTEHEVRLSFADTGIGLTPEEAAQLFQPFRRVARKAHQIEGTGLGLYIVRQFLERMHGRIDLQSEPGVGSTFTVCLPPA